MIAYIARTAEAAGIEKQPSPWKTELPDLFSWKKLPVEGGFDGGKMGDDRCSLVISADRYF